MAKQKQIPAKQAYYEQILTSQLQPSREEELKSFQADYDNWNKRQQDIAAFQADYDNWVKAQTPVEQPKVGTPKVEAPVAEQPVVKQPVAQPSIAPRKTQVKTEEQPIEKKTYLTHADIIPSLTKVNVDKQKMGARKITADNISDDLIKQAAQKYGLTEDEMRARLQPKEEKFEAPGKVDEETTKAVQEAIAEDDRKRVQKKYKANEAFFENMAKASTDIVNAPVAIAGRISGKDWSLYSDAKKQAFKDMQEQHPVASGAGKAAGMAFAALYTGGGVGGAQNAVNAGQVYNALRDEAILNGATKGTAALYGLKAAIPVLAANAANAMPVDLATDIVPTLANDLAEGEKTDEEILRDTLINTGTNYGFDAAGDLVSIVNAARKSGRAVNADDAFKANIREGYEKLKTLNDIDADIAAKNADIMAKNTVDNTVDDLDNILKEGITVSEDLEADKALRELYGQEGLEEASKFTLPDETFHRIDDYVTALAEPLNKVQRSGIMDTVTDPKAIKEWDSVNKAYEDFVTKAMESENIDDVVAAQKTLDARAMKDIDPSISAEFNSGSYGRNITRPAYERKLAIDNEQNAQETFDLIKELEESNKPQSIDNVPRSVEQNIDNVIPENKVMAAEMEGAKAPDDFTIEEALPPGQGFVENGKSRVLTNSAVNANIIDVDTLKNDPILQDIAKYEKHSNSDIFNSAMKRIEEEGDSWKNDIISGKKTISDDVDVDSSMILLQDLAYKIDTADDATKAALTAERNSLLSKLREYGTKSAQGIQAFAKWNNTADGALLAAGKLQEDEVIKPWVSQNKKAAEGNSRLARALADMGNKWKQPKEAIPLTHDQVKAGIRAELNKEFGNIEGLFNDNDIEYLARLAEDKSIPTWKIADEIEHKKNFGKWYSLDESTPQVIEKSNRLTKILDSVVGGKQLVKNPVEKTPETIYETMRKIKNTLDDESAGFAGQFTDDDYYYLANLIQEKVPNWKIEDEIRHRLQHGKWYTLDESLPEKAIKNNKLSKMLDNVLNGKQETKKAKEMTIGELLTGIKNTLSDENLGVAAKFNDNDYYFIAKMMEENVPRWQIEDELKHKLDFGEWYTLDESIPEKIARDNALSKMLDNIVNGKQASQTAKQAKEMTTGELLTRIKNTLNDESIGVADKFTDADYYFIAKMKEENVPKWQIEDEIKHKLDYGEWYTLDESLPIKEPTNRKLQNALNSLIESGNVRPEKVEPNINDIANEVRNTLNRESAKISSDFTDDDVNYLAGLIKGGATKEELSGALNAKMATGNFGVSLETQQKVSDLFKYIENKDPNSRAFVEAQAEAFRLLAEEIAPKASFLEKFDTWRYMAMLGNPKTMLRNFVGNKMFGFVTGFSNTLAALGEAGVNKAVKAFGGEGIQRTKAVLNPAKDGNLIKASAADVEDSVFRQLQGAKYEKIDKDFLRQSRSVWSSKLMRKWEELIDKGISDYGAMKKKYTTSLAGYLKANGYDDSAFEAAEKYTKLQKESKIRVLSGAEQAEMDSLSKVASDLDKAREYAIKQAKYATFHEDNIAADLISRASKKARESNSAVGNAMGYAIEGTSPFKKAPANILRSGVEYSPLGAIDIIRKTGKLIYENTGKRAGNLAETYTRRTLKGGLKEVNKTLAADVIDSWAKTLTGTGLTALGMYLYNKGILHIADPDLKYQDQLEGIQNYAIDINGHTYTMDWAVPAFMPIYVGAEISKLNQANGRTDEEGYKQLSDYLAVANRLAEPLVETSMLQGIKDTLETAATTAQYDDVASVPLTLAYNSLTGYLTQAIPTISGQIARTVDNTRRSTYSDKSDAIERTLDRQGKKILNKIPGLSMLNQPYIDTYGRQQTNSPFNDIDLNFAYQTLSPGYYSKVNTTDADRLSREIYDYNKTKSVLPEYQTSFKDSDGNRVSPEDYTTASLAYGQANKEIRDALANDEWFNGLDAAEKEEIVKGINTISEHVGKAAIDPEYSNNSKGFNAYKDGGIPSLLDYYKKENAKDIANESGLDSKTKASQDIQNDILNGNTEKAQEKISEASHILDSGINSHGYDVYTARKANIDNMDNWISEYKKIDSLGNADGFVNQKEFISAIKKNGWSEQDAVKYSKLYGNWETIPYLKKDGTWGFHKAK